MYSDATTVTDARRGGARTLRALLDRLERSSNGLVGFESLRTTALLAVGRVGGPVLSMIVAASFGASRVTDRFFVAFALATYALETIITIGESTAVPFLVEARLRGAASRRLIIRMALGSAVAGFVLVAAAAAFLLVSQPRQLGGEAWLWVAGLTGYVVAGAVASAITGALYAAGRYGPAAACSGLRPVAAIGVVLGLGPALGIGAVAVGLTVGAILQASLVAWLAWRVYAATGASNDRPLQFGRFLREASWQLAGSLIVGLLPVADRLAAATLPDGSVSLLEYSTRIWSVPVTLLVTGVLVVCLTNWSELGLRDPAELRRSVHGAARAMLALSSVLVAGLILGRHTIVETLLGWGSMSDAQLSEASLTFALLAVGIPFYLSSLLYSRAVIAVRRTRWLFLIAIVALIVKVTLNASLSPILGLAGVALATSLTYGVTIPLLVYAFHRASREQDVPRMSWKLDERSLLGNG